jgi:predicted phosphodiesterase
MTKQLRWLHLSDIHFRGKSKLDQNDAFARIRTDLTRRTAEGNGPDLIFVSGDLVFSGQPEDFQEILKRLDELCGACKLSRDRVFFCPGNHDSDISVAPVLLQGCWKSFTDIAAFQSFLDSPEFQELKRRQASYRGFVEAFRGASAGFDSHELHSESLVELGDLRVGVLSVNSSLLANGGADDQGKLQVCIRSLEEPCERLKRCDVRFVLIHHPFEWLAAFESDRAETLIFNSGDIILRGHVHRRRLIGSLRGGIASTAGAVWDETAGDYEYSFGLIECDSLTCTIESVRYMQQTGDWMLNLKTVAISRDRDERCTPSLVWDELKGSLRYPAQIAAVVSGYSSELVAQTAGGLTYVSTERILAEYIRSQVDTPALGVTRVGTLLMFYGHVRLGSVLRSELDVLHAYDRMLESESQRDAGFAALVRSREQAAERIVRSSPDQVESWSDRYIRRLVSEGDSNAIFGLQDSVGGGSLGALKSALADGARDPYEAWLKIGGSSLEFGELATVATRLASSRTADLAARALADAAERFPADARRLEDIARVIAIEARDPGVYERFRKATVRQ